MTTYSYAQLEGLWINAGGPRALAPIAAAIAEAESGGDSEARNASGAAGLWQILGVPFPGNPMDAQTNAKMAVAKWRQAPGGGDNFSPWVTFTDGSYRAHLRGSVPASATVGGGGTAAAGASSGGGTTQAQLTGFLTAPSGVLNEAGALLHGGAVVLDRVFGMFAPGQGWRSVFGLSAIFLLYMSWRAFGGAL